MHPPLPLLTIGCYNAVVAAPYNRSLCKVQDKSYAYLQLYSKLIFTYTLVIIRGQISFKKPNEIFVENV